MLAKIFKNQTISYKTDKFFIEAVTFYTVVYLRPTRQLEKNTHSMAFNFSWIKFKKIKDLFENSNNFKFNRYSENFIIKSTAKNEPQLNYFSASIYSKKIFHFFNNIGENFETTKSVHNLVITILLNFKKTELVKYSIIFYNLNLIRIRGLTSSNTGFLIKKSKPLNGRKLFIKNPYLL